MKRYIPLFSLREEQTLATVQRTIDSVRNSGYRVPDAYFVDGGTTYAVVNTFAFVVNGARKRNIPIYNSFHDYLKHGTKKLELGDY